MSLSLTLSLSLRSLNCGRTKMHKNLFAALALNNVCWIVWYTTVPYQPQVLNENPVRGPLIRQQCDM